MIYLTFYVVGLLAGLSAYVIYLLHKTKQPGWLKLSCMSIGIVLVLFSVAWGVGSILEGVPRAASMGMLLFGFPGLLAITVAARNINR